MPRPAAPRVADGERARELLELGTEARGAAGVREALRFIEVGPQLLEAGAIGAARALVGSVVDRAAAVHREVGVGFRHGGARGRDRPGDELEDVHLAPRHREERREIAWPLPSLSRSSRPA